MGRKLRLACLSSLFLLCYLSASQAAAAAGATPQAIDVHWNKKAGKCRAGKHGLKCSQCPKGYFSEDGTHCIRCTKSRTTHDCPNGCTSQSDCTEIGCPVGTFKAPTSSECEPCPVGQYTEGGYPYPKACKHCPKGTSTPGRGSYSIDQCVPEVCPAGTSRLPGSVNCAPCKVGSYSVEGADDCSLCPEGMTTLEAGSRSLDECVCKAGYEPSRDADGVCKRCKLGTFKPHKGNQMCEECAWPRSTEKTGALSIDACVCPAGSGKGPNCDECPDNTVLMTDGTCGCPPGTGGPTCEECKPNFFSAGGQPGQPRPNCKPCGLHFHSPAGSMSAEYCECDIGYGADPEDDHRCVPCALGTFNPGSPQMQLAHYRYQSAAVTVAASAPANKDKALHTPVAKPCQRCGAAHPDGVFTTLQSGSISAADCICLPGYGGSSCSACPAGTYSVGGPSAVCQSCPAGGAGYTTDPEAAATSIAACVCLAGYGISDNGMCKMCPKNTYSEGGTKEECKPCPFGSTSPPGSADLEACASVAQECPVGQMAPADAVSREQCACYPGFGGGGSPDAPCTICPAGTYSRGGDLEACKPCKFGHTSAVGSTSSKDCYSVDQCPAGTEVPTSTAGAAASTTQECRCKAGYGSSTGSGSCRLCPPGTYSTGGTMEDCKPCAFGLTSKAGAVSAEECVEAAQACPVGQIAVGDAVSGEQCACLPGYGGGKTPDEACSICKAGTFAPGGNTQPCQPCRFGYTSSAGSTAEAQCYPANACPAGTEAPKNREIASVAECVCKAGFGINPSSKDGTCSLCPAGTFSLGGSMAECTPCSFGSTSPVGATSKRECVVTPQACPIGQWAPADAVSKEQCVCYPGFGGGDKPGDPCTICPAGTYSPGKSLDKCVPCAFGTTSPVGSSSDEDCYPVKQCPAGTRVPESKFRPGYASSASECKCLPGYGSTTGQGTCRICPIGTYAPGENMEDCKKCPFGTTSEAGATDISECRPVPQKCPPGQIAPANAVSEDECSCLPGYGGGADSKDPCHICPAGTWAPGGNTQPCIPCGFGYASPEGSSSESACYTTNACPSGTEPHRSIDTPSALSDCVCKSGYGSPLGTGICRLCAANTYSIGGTMEDCKKCPFGTTSAEGSTAKDQCRAVPQACPLGQWAPPDAVSAEECRCYKGFGGGDKPTDPCTICPAGTFSANKGTAKCVPCRFGFTSPEGAEDEAECYHIDVCPAGTEIPRNEAGASSLECKCKPGHGSAKGAGPCHTCPVGTYSEGGTMEDCKACPWGQTSKAGAESIFDCVAAARSCPPGQVAPPDAVSPEQCACLPGYGAGETAGDACHMCPAGSWSPGGSIQPCIPCGFGYSGPEGAVSGDQCVPDNVCPAGTDYRQGDPEKAFTLADCVCKPGFGSASGSGICRLCPAGTFSEGGTMEDCKPCGFGFTSADGATKRNECKPVEQPCPIGQWAPPDAVSEDSCRCYRGFGGGEKPTDPCTICPGGTYSANKGTERCRPCPLGFLSPEGAQSEEQCYPINICPAGTDIEGGLPPLSLSQCKCKPGYGSHTGSAPCHLCPIGTFSVGWSLEDCRPCPFGMTSEAGTTSVDGCVPVVQSCPVGQIAPPDAVSAEECACLPGFGAGETPTAACKACPPGYWSPGGRIQPCKSCGFGYTSPEGATSADQCVAINACPAGTMFRDVVLRGGLKPIGLQDCVCKAGHGSTTGSAPCKLCPAGTWSPGGNLEECAPCGFGFTSAEGSTSDQDCRPVSQMCPIGQWASQDAVSAAECRCYRGFGGGDKPTDACSLCPAGTYSANIGTERCSSCPPGFTSAEGSGDESECYPAEMCPAGTALVRDARGHLSKDCKCKEGYGSSTGSAPCRLCPVGSYSQGGSMEDCMPCPFGQTSRAGAESAKECVPESQKCPIGQIAPPDAVSPEQCGCLPGYGGGASSKHPCRVCAPGSWSPGGSTQPCIPCGFGYSGPEGAWSERQCTQVNACPAGTEYIDHPGKAFSVNDCVCKPGHGSATGSGVCKRCPRGTYSPGGSMEDCVPCPDGRTSPEGSWTWRECMDPFTAGTYNPWSTWTAPSDTTPVGGSDPIGREDEALAIMNKGATAKTNTQQQDPGSSSTPLKQVEDQQRTWQELPLEQRLKELQKREEQRQREEQRPREEKRPHGQQPLEQYLRKFDAVDPTPTHKPRSRRQRYNAAMFLPLTPSGRSSSPAAAQQQKTNSEPLQQAPPPRQQKPFTKQAFEQVPNPSDVNYLYLGREAPTAASNATGGAPSKTHQPTQQQQQQQQQQQKPAVDARPKPQQQQQEPVAAAQPKQEQQQQQAPLLDQQPPRQPTTSKQPQQQQLTATHPVQQPVPAAEQKTPQQQQQQVQQQQQAVTKPAQQPAPAAAEQKLPQQQQQQHQAAPVEHNKQPQQQQAAIPGTAPAADGVVSKQLLPQQQQRQQASAAEHTNQLQQQQAVKTDAAPAAAPVSRQLPPAPQQQQQQQVPPAAAVTDSQAAAPAPAPTTAADARPQGASKKVPSKDVAPAQPAPSQGPNAGAGSSPQQPQQQQQQQQRPAGAQLPPQPAVAQPQQQQQLNAPGAAAKQQPVAVGNSSSSDPAAAVGSSPTTQAGKSAAAAAAGQQQQGAKPQKLQRL